MSQHSLNCLAHKWLYSPLLPRTLIPECSSAHTRLQLHCQVLFQISIYNLCGLYFHNLSAHSVQCNPACENGPAVLSMLSSMHSSCLKSAHCSSTSSPLMHICL